MENLHTCRSFCRQRMSGAPNLYATVFFFKAHRSSNFSDNANQNFMEVCTG